MCPSGFPLKHESQEDMSNQWLQTSSSASGTNRHDWERIQSGSKHPAHKPGYGIESFRRPNTHHQATTERRECYQRCVTARTLTSAFTRRLSLVLSAKGQPHKALECPSLISLTLSVHVKHPVYLLSFCVCRTTSEDFKNQSNKPLFPSCRFLANT